jgi:putative phosphoserine phosphatase/1-acylglycerol-3-phosphate O-acyltransferase
MSLKKKIKFPVSGYLDLLSCGVSYAMGNLDAKKGYETLFKHMNKMSQAQVKEKCDLIWEQDCKNYIYKDADRLFNEYKKQGLKLILVDAGISELYQEFLKIYKFDYVLVANLEYKNNLSTGKLVGEPSSGIHKYNMVKKLIEQDLHGSLDQAIFYANSHNDIPLLEHVGKPMPVNPNKKLERFAKQKNWPILTFTELKK